MRHASTSSAGPADLDTLLIALYVTIDDLLDRPSRWPGRRPLLSNSELVCLAVAQVLLGCPSEHRWLRFAYVRLGHLFPYLPQQPGYNKRLRALAPALSSVLHELARQTPSWCDRLRLLDATPVPCASSRETVERSALRGYANYGYCASHSRYFWGFKLYLLTTADGLVVDWCLADPKLGEAEVAEALLDSNAVQEGQILVCDKGFADRFLAARVSELGATLLRPDRKDEALRNGSLGPVRQWIESIIDTLKGQLSLEEHGARTPAGVLARVAQRLLALAAAVWWNWQIDAPEKRSLVAYDH
jgi:hypothetical protein